MLVPLSKAIVHWGYIIKNTILYDPDIDELHDNDVIYVINKSNLQIEDIGKLINLDKERSIDVIITRVRKKIEIDQKSPKFLQTIRGAGYVLWIE